MIDSIDELHDRFTHHPPTPAQGERHAAIRAHALGLARLIDGSVPTSRERSLALTALEEVVFWANAAIARHG